MSKSKKKIKVSNTSKKIFYEIDNGYIRYASASDLGFIEKEVKKKYGFTLGKYLDIADEPGFDEDLYFSLLQQGKVKHSGYKYIKVYHRCEPFISDVFCTGAPLRNDRWYPTT